MSWPALFANPRYPVAGFVVFRGTSVSIAGNSAAAWWHTTSKLTRRRRVKIDSRTRGDTSANRKNTGATPADLRRPWRLGAALVLTAFILLSCRPSCSGGDAAIDEQGLSRNVGTSVRGEEHDRPIQIVRLARALERNTVDDVLNPSLVLVKDRILLGTEPPRSQAVYRNPMRSPFIREAHCQLLDAPSASAIRGDAGITEDARNRSDVDNPSVAAFDHAARECLGNKERTAQICVEYQVPIVPGNVERRFAHVATRVVDKNIDLAEVI